LPTDAISADFSRKYMTDPRYQKLARLLVEYSTALKKGDRILLDMIDVPDGFMAELIRAACRRKCGSP
jgi:aminopeptidase